MRITSFESLPSERDIVISLYDYDSWRFDTVDALRANNHLIQSLRIKARFSENRLNFFLGYGLPAFPRLNSIELKGPCEYDYDEDISKFLSLTSAPMGLKNIVFDKGWNYGGYFDFGFESFNALLSHVSTLEVLRLNGKSFITSEQIDELLSCAPRLKELYLFGGNCKAEVNCLDARDVAKSAWVCSNLEVFACQIRNIPRPDITRDIAGRAARVHIDEHDTPLHESVELQRQVYKQLGRLTKLRELSLGFPVDTAFTPSEKDFHRQYDCLAMTLESGLDLLKDLKDLRVVGLEDMEVYSDGDREQDWFAKNWPRARVSTTHVQTPPVQFIQ
ncbi:hypothetical protein K457DRAFT_25424 [Linnemannia elongata AG-77]|uniref:RNI-like protein n=1 Tax=Linnemannia elongata AG-77 TaxID=1314771 RepID=A0A197JF51_9FUNG|nr:hypothetical protein K457DRAFT_25424 [Linnemannia elongata AG-77]